MFTKEKIETLFNNLNNKRVLVVGDVMIDRYLRGNVSRISPEAPVPIVEMESEEYLFGGAANVSLNLKTLGCEPVTLGLIGDDPNGKIFKQLLDKEKIPSSGLIIADDRPTTVKTRIIGDSQHMVRVDREKIIYDNQEVEQKIINRFSDLVKNIDGIILEDYNKGVLSRSVIKFILEYSNAHNIPVNVDPKFENFLDYKNVTVFKPNIIETARALAKPIKDDIEVEKAGFELLEKLSSEYVLLTRGAKGLSLFDSKKSIHHIPAKTLHVADVSGAGDTVIATLTAMMLAGANVIEAAEIANHAAGIVCGEVGIVPILKEDLKKKLMESVRNA